LYKPKHKQKREKPRELKHLSIREKRKQSDFQSSGEEMKKEFNHKRVKAPMYYMWKFAYPTFCFKTIGEIGVR